MRIGVDACSWVNVRGYGRFTRELLRAMVAAAPQDHFLCFLDPLAAASFDLRAANVEPVEVKQSVAPDRAGAEGGARSLSDMLRLSRAVGEQKVDVFFSPSVYTYFPLPRKLPAVVGIHDTIPERFPRLTFPSPKARLFWRLKMWLALHQADRVLTVSDYSARQIAALLRVRPERIHVAVEAPAGVYRPAENPAEIDAVASRLGLPPAASWFVYVGGFSPHKRIESIVRAHAAVVNKTPGDGPYLLLVGPGKKDVFHQDVARIEQAVKEAGTGSLVIWTGFLEDEDLRRLHTRALGLVLVSECEGFGLPAVEAAACGSPVIATTESPLPDLLAGGGFFVQPGDQEALEAAMLSLATDEDARRSLGAEARRRADLLTWEKSAAATLAALAAAAPQTA